MRVSQNKNDLAYFVARPISNCRLAKTFEASNTLYWILIFLYLFRKAAVGELRRGFKKQIRDNTYVSHGVPPKGGAQFLAEYTDNIKRCIASKTS